MIPLVLVGLGIGAIVLGSRRRTAAAPPVLKGTVGKAGVELGQMIGGGTTAGLADAQSALEISEALQEAVDSGARAAPIMPGTMVAGIMSVEGDMRIVLRDKERGNALVEVLLSDVAREGQHTIGSGGYSFTDVGPGMATTGEIVMPGFPKPGGGYMIQRLPGKRWPAVAYNRVWAIEIPAIPPIANPDMPAATTSLRMDGLIRGLTTIHRETPPRYIMGLVTDSDLNNPLRLWSLAIQKKSTFWRMFSGILKSILGLLLSTLANVFSGNYAGAVLGFVNFAMTEAVAAYTSQGQQVPAGLRKVAHVWGRLPVYAIMEAASAGISSLQGLPTTAASSRLFGAATSAATAFGTAYVKKAMLAAHARMEGGIEEINNKLRSEGEKYRVEGVNGVMDWHIGT